MIFIRTAFHISEFIALKYVKVCTFHTKKFTQSNPKKQWQKNFNKSHVLARILDWFVWSLVFPMRRFFLLKTSAEKGSLSSSLFTLSIWGCGTYQRKSAYYREEFISMLISNAVAFIRGWRLFEVRCLFEEICTFHAKMS